MGWGGGLLERLRAKIAKAGDIRFDWRRGCCWDGGGGGDVDDDDDDGGGW